MSNAYGVNLSDSMIAVIDEVPEQKIMLPYSAGKKFKAVLLLVLVPLFAAAGLLIAVDYFTAALPESVRQGMIWGAAAAFLVLFFGLFRVQKYYKAHTAFGEKGVECMNQLYPWGQVEHAEVLSEPRQEDKASIILYLQNDQQLGFRIRKHDKRMKVSEVIRRHVDNIAFKD